MLKINVPENIKAVCDILENNGFQAFLAGGCVRDHLMGIRPHDYDIATNARPERVMSCFDGFRMIETGLKHGTVTVVSGGENVEITTYRVDGGYTDHRRPDSVSFAADIADDVSRRDFTVNAMAYSEKRGLIDLFGGRDDLRNRMIRCVGEPSERFDEDALRILRALRFASRLGFSAETKTSAAIHEMKELLGNISKERIFSELKQILCGQSAPDIIREYYDVFAVIIPQLGTLYNADVRELAARRISASENITEVRLALLLMSAEGDTPGNILRSLKSDRLTAQTVGRPVMHGGISPTDDRIEIKKLLNKLGEHDLSLLIYVIKADASARGDSEKALTAEKMRAEMNEIISSGQCFSVAQLGFGGKDAENIGFRGRETGDIIKYLLGEVIEEHLPNEKTALVKAASERYSSGS